MFEDTKDEIETITGRTDNTMVKKNDKKTNNDLQNTTETTKD